MQNHDIASLVGDMDKSVSLSKILHYCRKNQKNKQWIRGNLQQAGPQVQSLDASCVIVQAARVESGLGGWTGRGNG